MACNDRLVRTEMQRAGDRAEAMVALQLESSGWTVLGRNVRVGRDELDIVAVDPGPPPRLVVAEVRWRAHRSFGLPEETVDRRKRARMLRAALRLVLDGRLPRGEPLPTIPLRFDLVAVEPGGADEHEEERAGRSSRTSNRTGLRVRHYRDVVEAPG